MLNKEKIQEAFRRYRKIARDYLNLLFKSAHYNYFYVESCRKDPQGGYHFDVYCSSYSALKKFQSRMRRIVFGSSAIIATVIVTSLTTQYIAPAFRAKAAIFNVSWSSQGNFENNGVQGASTSTVRTHIDTTSSSGDVSVTQYATQNFTETFTTTNNRDIDKTSADWNTASGEIKYPASGGLISTKLTGKLSEVLGSSEEILFVVYVSDSAYIFLSAKVLEYNFTTDVVTDHTSKFTAASVSIGGNTTNVKYNPLDGASGSIYTLGRNTSQSKFDLSSKTVTRMDSCCWATTYVRDFAYNEQTGKWYLVGDNKFFKEYSVSNTTGISLSSNLSSDWISTVSLKNVSYFDNYLYLSSDAGVARYNLSDNSVLSLNGKLNKYIGSISTINSIVEGGGYMYLGLGDGAGYKSGFVKLNPVAGTSTDLSSHISIQNPVLAYSAAEKLVFAGGRNGYFYVYNTEAGTTTNLTSGLSAITTGDIYSIVSDNNGNVYIGCASAKLVKYNIATGVFTDVSSYISSFWSSNTIYSLVFDPTHNYLIIGGSAGKLAYYDIAGATSTNASAAFVAAMGGSYTIQSMVFDPVEGVTYFGCSSGSRFGKYNPANGQVTSYSSVFSGAALFNTAYSLNLDQLNRIIYIAGTVGGASRSFVKYDIVGNTAQNLATTLNGASNQATIYSSIFHDNNVYLVGRYGYFNKFATISAQAEDEFEHIAGSVYPQYVPDKISYSSADNSMYFVYNNNVSSADALLLRYDHNSGIEYQLNATTSLAGQGWNSSEHIYDMKFASGNIYLSATYNRLARYNIASSTFSNISIPFLTNLAADRIDSLHFDAGSNKLYFGGTKGKFGIYDIGQSTSTDWSAKPARELLSSFNIQDEAIDTASGSVYFVDSNSTGGPRFGRYNIYAETADNLESAVSSCLTANTGLKTVAYNPNDRMVYVGGNSGNFARYDIASGACTNLKNDISGLSSVIINMIRIDAVSNIIYIGASSGKFYKYNPANRTGVDESSKVSGTFSTNYIYELAIDHESGFVYLGGDSSRLAKYNISAGTSTDLTASLNATFAGSTVKGMVYASTSDALYIGSGNGKFAAYYKASSSFEDLTTKISSFWSGGSMESIVFDSQANNLYFGDNSSKYAKYSLATLLATNYTTNIALPSVTTIYGMAYNPVNGLVYLGGAGSFKSAMSADMVYAQSVAIDTVADSIGWATLTKTSNGAGVLKYYLTNNGTDFFEVTPGVQFSFPTRGSDLRFKIGVEGTSAVQDIAISYGGYYDEGTITNLVMDTGGEALYNNIFWNADLNGGDVRFWTRTASTQAGLVSANWDGPYLTSGSGILSPSNQWIEAKTVLYSSGTATPALHDFSIQYVLNVRPEVQNVQASSTADGKVNVTFETRDQDTTQSSGFVGFVDATLQYCSANCANSGSETWTDATTVTYLNGTSTVAVEEGDWNSYSLIWNIKQDYDEQYNSTNFKVRVKVDDHEVKMNLGYATSSPFIIDTTDPTSADIGVDASRQYGSNEAVLTFGVNDEATSIIDNEQGWMKITQHLAIENCIADLSAATYVRYASTSTLHLNDDSAVVCVRFKDKYGNESPAASVTTPPAPPTLMVQDISNVKRAPFEYRMFVAWAKADQPAQGTFAKYVIMTSPEDDDASYTVKSEITDININYFTDVSVVMDEMRYYKIYVVDSLGNASFRSNFVNGKANGTEDAGEGGGGTPSTPPVITNVSSSNVYTTQAQFTWNTDTLSNSTVGFSTTTGDFTHEIGSATMVDNAGAVGIHRVVVTGLSPDTTYYYRVRSTDAYGNIGTDDNGGQGYVFTTQPGPTVSNVRVTALTNDSATIAWDTDMANNSYVTYSSNQDMASSTEFGRNDSATQHSITLSGLTEGMKYYFSVRSGESAIDDNAGDYYSFTVPTGPSISNVVATPSRYSVSVNWQTNVANSSYVVVSEDTAFSTFREVGLENSVTDHTIVVNGLDENKTYYFYVRSGTTREDNGGQYYSFTTSIDITAPVISNLVVTSITDDTALIRWSTNEMANSTVLYGLASSSLELTETDAENNVSHSILLSGLDNQTRYYLKVRSIDPYSNGSESEVIDFTTLKNQIDEPDPDQAPPAISDLTVTNISDDSAVVRWKTDEAADSRVNYGLSGDNLPLSETDADDNISHAIALNNLSASTRYYLQVASADGSSNTSTSQVIDFATLKTQVDQPEAQPAQAPAGGGVVIIDKTDKKAPVIKDVQVKTVGDTYAKLQWTTDEPANSFVSYGQTEDYASLQGNFNSLNSPVTTHVVDLTGLADDTAYNFAAVSIDPSGNIGRLGNFKFRTVKAGEAPQKDVDPSASKLQDAENIERLINDLLSSGKADQETIRDIVKRASEPPVISGDGPKVEAITSRSAVISWTTDRKANSIIVYYPVSEGQDAAKQAGDFETMTQDHQVEISGLQSDAAYVFRAQSIDALGNMGASHDDMFTTSKVPYISKVSIEDVKDKTAIIAWQSNRESTSEIEYGLDGRYGKKVSASDALTADHKVTLSGLKGGETYHFRVLGFTRGKEQMLSDDYTFITLADTAIESYNVSQITDKKAIVAWKTNNKTTSQVDIRDKKTGEHDTLLKDELSNDHKFDLKDLNPGADYAFTVGGKDENGKEVKSQEFGFRTLLDDKAPLIDFVKTEMALISKGETAVVQAIVSWKTDEPASTELFYVEGANREITASTTAAVAVKGEDILSTKHVLVITDFKPGTIYTFRAKSIDSAGNISYSKDSTVLTPNRSDSIFQVIVKTFEDTFGWMKVW